MLSDALGEGFMFFSMRTLKYLAGGEEEEEEGEQPVTRRAPSGEYTRRVR